jgi:hypothetical protein
MLTPLLLALGLSGAALALDPTYAAYDALLQANVSPQGVTYAAIGPAGLDPFLAELAAVDLRELNPIEQKALFINAYNALTLDLIAENPGVASIRDLDGGKVWSTRRFTVGGQSLTLDDIEHKRLRPMGDPRVHAALSCASKGCPALLSRAYTAERLNDQLDLACRAWVRSNAAQINTQAKTVALSSIFDWYGDDFLAQWEDKANIPGVEGKQQAALNFIAFYSGSATATWLTAGGYTVTWATYDWGVNRR